MVLTGVKELDCLFQEAIAPLAEVTTVINQLTQTKLYMLKSCGFTEKGYTVLRTVTEAGEVGGEIINGEREPVHTAAAITALETEVANAKAALIAAEKKLPAPEDDADATVDAVAAVDKTALTVRLTAAEKKLAEAAVIAAVDAVASAKKVAKDKEQALVALKSLREVANAKAALSAAEKKQAALGDDADAAVVAAAVDAVVAAKKVAEVKEQARIPLESLPADGRAASPADAVRRLLAALKDRHENPRDNAVDPDRKYRPEWAPPTKSSGKTDDVHSGVTYIKLNTVKFNIEPEPNRLNSESESDCTENNDLLDAMQKLEAFWDLNMQMYKALMMQRRYVNFLSACAKTDQDVYIKQIEALFSIKDQEKAVAAIEQNVGAMKLQLKGLDDILKSITKETSSVQSGLKEWYVPVGKLTRRLCGAFACVYLAALTAQLQVHAQLSRRW